jgi:hypothetical protein
MSDRCLVCGSTHGCACQYIQANKDKISYLQAALKVADKALERVSTLGNGLGLAQEIAAEALATIRSLKQ